MRRFIFLGIAVFFLASGSGIFSQTPPRWLDIGIGMVFLVMANASRTRRPRMGTLDESGLPTETKINEEQLQEITNLISEEKKIEAIKRYQDLTGINILEAEEYIENLVDNMEVDSLPLPPHEHPKESIEETLKLPLPTDLEEAIITIASSNQDEAVQKVIELTSVDIAEAQAYIETLNRN